MNLKSGSLKGRRIGLGRPCWRAEGPRLSGLPRRGGSLSLCGKIFSEHRRVIHDIHRLIESNFCTHVFANIIIMLLRQRIACRDIVKFGKCYMQFPKRIVDTA